MQAFRRFSPPMLFHLLQIGEDLRGGPLCYPLHLALVPVLLVHLHLPSPPLARRQFRLGLAVARSHQPNHRKELTRGKYRHAEAGQH